MPRGPLRGAAHLLTMLGSDAACRGAFWAACTAALTYKSEIVESAKQDRALQLAIRRPCLLLTA